MTFLVIVHIFICIVLVGVILLQPGKGDAGIGFGSSSQSIFGSKGASNFLTKTTSACAMFFLVTSFLLTRARMLEHTSSVISEDAPPAATAPAAAVPAPGADAKAPAADAPAAKTEAPKGK